MPITKVTTSWLLDRTIPEPNSGCWLWLYAVNQDGYGIARDPTSGRPDKAHRIAFRLLKGVIPNDLHILHKCDNPSCCNPDHLFLGTQGDNNSDRHAKGRDGNQKGMKHHNAKLTDQQVLEIRGIGKSYSVKYVAALYGVSISLIYKVKSKESWGHL